MFKFEKTRIIKYQKTKTVIIEYPPSITGGIDNLSTTIFTHFKFINKKHFEGIYLFIKEISQLHSLDYNNIESITRIRFKIGEIEYYPKNGNILIELPDKFIEGTKPILKQYVIDVKNDYKNDDNYSTIIVYLNF